MRKIVFASLLLLLACSSVAFERHYILDPPNQNLRGKAEDGSEDLPLSECNPVQIGNGDLKYKCVVHFFEDYESLLQEIGRLKAELKACQEARL